MPKKEKVRPTISSPTGPVWNSRGQALERGVNFSVVGEIEGWSGNSTPTTALPDTANSSAMNTTRRVSASFSSNLRPSASPTVASSSFNATTPAQAPAAQSAALRFLRKPSFPPFGKSKSTKTLIPTSTTTSTLPGRAPANRGENVPPPAASDLAPNSSQAPRQASKLPKSRTMNVLHELKNSFSRHNLNARFNDARREPVASQLPGPSRTSSLQPPLPAPSQSAGRTPRAVAVQASLATPRSPVSPAISQGTQTSRGPSQQSQHQSTSAADPSRRLSTPAAFSPRGPSQQSQRSQQSQHQSVVSGGHSRRQSTGSSALPSRGLSRQSQRPQQQPVASGGPSRRQSIASAGLSSQRPSAASTGPSTRSATPEPTPAQITTAQPMQYWTGRLSGLTDHYMNEDRGPEMLLALQSGLMAQGRTWDSVKDIPAEDAIQLVIFAQLEFLSSTEEAKESLLRFQEYFAKRHNRSMLLPLSAQSHHMIADFVGSRRRGAMTSRRESTGSSQTQAPNASNPS